MAAQLPDTKERPGAEQFSRHIPPLENGDHLSGREFLRRYEAMPEVKKAELINGIVIMGPPVRYVPHAKPDGLIQTWLGTYAVATPGIEHATNSTVSLGPDDNPPARRRVENPARAWRRNET